MLIIIYINKIITIIRVIIALYYNLLILKNNNKNKNLIMILVLYLKNNKEIIKYFKISKNQNLNRIYLKIKIKYKII